MANFMFDLKVNKDKIFSKYFLFCVFIFLKWFDVFISIPKNCLLAIISMATSLLYKNVVCGGQACPR
jgi:hypothetical protein